MTSSEHQELANFIKSVHKKLRCESKILGTEKSWTKHCQDQENLKRYASAMQQLAVNHWEKNSLLGDKAISRVSWIYLSCKEYFANVNKYREKEEHIMKTCFKTPTKPQEYLNNSKLKVLDVGSCYNPFKQFEIFDVTAVDIAPANKEVLKCDFLNLTLPDLTINLLENSFNIVIFSLLLEYFPSTNQRLKCCLNAYKLLKPESILTIITPDSNHVGSNAKIFKSWRYVLAKHGFIRVKYEKLPYLHCMLFRKALYPEVAKRWAEVHESEGLFNEMFIPQDFRSKVKNETRLKGKWIEDTFLQEFDL